MQIKEKLVDTLRQLDEEAILQLYDIALAFKKKNISSYDTINFENITRSHDLLSSIKGLLSSDISAGREDRC